ncbi:hypothetical protein M407DRAFT_216834, partial [Tulasnella calospora MUT 4182]
DKLGWMAVGFGTEMPNSPMVITWPNSDGTITISQREATEHVMPRVVANPTDIATLAAGNTILSANSTIIAFTYPLPSAPQNAVPMIWSYSTKKPSSSAVDATIVQHDKMGTATMDLSQSVNALATGTGATTTVVGTSTQTIIPLPTGASSHESSNEDIPLTDSEKTIRTHGILMTTGVLLCLPIGIFIARFSRTVSFLKGRWFTAHWFVQFIVSGPIIISGWFIAYNFVGEDHFRDSHTRVGLLLLLLYIVQMLLGAIIHFFKPKRTIAGRPIQNYAHALLGLTIIALGLYNVHEGYGDEWLIIFGSRVSEVPDEDWFHLVSKIIPLVYVAGLSLLPRQWRQETNARRALPPT